jgi:hypothetical protein
MADNLTKPHYVDIAHSFDIWRQVTNLILRDQGNVDDLLDELGKDPTVHPQREFVNLVDIVNFIYVTTQSRLRHILVKSIGMS